MDDFGKNISSGLSWLIHFHPIKKYDFNVLCQVGIDYRRYG